LARLFNKGTAEISAEGVLIIHKICENMRERNLRNTHVRICLKDKALAARREKALTDAMRKELRVSESQIEHDNIGDTSRGEIAALWLKAAN
jgi:hypothetical protein